MTTKYLTEFLDEAYHLQRGEYRPETHAENLKRLADMYPDIPSVIQDQLYRFTITLDTCSKSFAERIATGDIEKAEALSELSITYRHFSKSTLEFALDWNS